MCCADQTRVARYTIRMIRYSWKTAGWIQCIAPLLFVSVGVAFAERQSSAESIATTSVASQAIATLPIKGAAAPMTVTVGAFVNNIPQVDLRANTFEFDAYIWFRWDPAAWPSSAEGGPAQTFEIMGASADCSKEVVYASDGYCCVQVKGVRTNFWDVRSYPFDQQRLQIVVEDSNFDTRELIYKADHANSGLAPSLRVSGCRVQPLEVSVTDFVYPTNFGDPAIAHGAASSYSRVAFSIPVARESWGIFIKLFTGLFVALSVASIALFINPTQVDPRFGLCVGGLFGIVASGYAVSSVLPDSSELGYADKLHVAALICVLLIVMESAIALALHLNCEERGARIARRLDRVMFVVIVAGYVTAAVTFTLSAMQELTPSV